MCGAFHAGNGPTLWPALSLSHLLPCALYRYSTLAFALVSSNIFLCIAAFSTFTPQWHTPSKHDIHTLWKAQRKTVVLYSFARDVASHYIGNKNKNGKCNWFRPCCGCPPLARHTVPVLTWISVGCFLSIYCRLKTADALDHAHDITNISL